LGVRALSGAWNKSQKNQEKGGKAGAGGGPHGKCRPWGVHEGSVQQNKGKKAGYNQKTREASKERSRGVGLQKNSRLTSKMAKEKRTKPKQGNEKKKRSVTASMEESITGGEDSKEAPSQQPRTI